MFCAEVVNPPCRSPLGMGRPSPRRLGQRSADLLFIGGAAYLDGPPPRAWGRPGQWKRPCASTRVHPHARGDDQLINCSGFDLYGPPPRAWGRPRALAAAGRADRSTPTRVGTTATNSSGPPLVPVHPHARGDDEMVPPWYGVMHGPPPRAWGRRQRSRYASKRERSTPTRVGTTCSS